MFKLLLGAILLLSIAGCHNEADVYEVAETPYTDNNYTCGVKPKGVFNF